MFKNDKGWTRYPTFHSYNIVFCLSFDKLSNFCLKYSGVQSNPSTISIVTTLEQLSYPLLPFNTSTHHYRSLMTAPRLLRTLFSPPLPFRLLLLPLPAHSPRDTSALIVRRTASSSCEDSVSRRAV